MKTATLTDNNAVEYKAIENILAITTAVSSSLDISEIFGIIVNRVAEALNAIDCSIVLMEKSGKSASVL